LLEVGVFQSEISEIEYRRRKPSVYLTRKTAKTLESQLGRFIFCLNYHILTITATQRLKKEYWVRF